MLVLQLSSHMLINISLNIKELIEEFNFAVYRTHCCEENNGVSSFVKVEMRCRL